MGPERGHGLAVGQGAVMAQMCFLAVNLSLVLGPMLPGPKEFRRRASGTHSTYTPQPLSGPAPGKRRYYPVTGMFAASATGRAC